MPTRRSLGEIYRDQRHLDKTVPSRKRAAVFTSLSVPIIGLSVAHVPLPVKISAWVLYLLIGVWVAVTSGRMAKAEGQPPDGTARKEAI